MKDLYYVAVKVFLRDGDKLLITKDIYGDWDLPGGRLRVEEFATLLADVIKRKMGEELGSDLLYELGEPSVFFRHQRNEHDSGKPVRIFGVGFAARYLSGALKLGKHHEKMEWVDVNQFKPEQYFTGGWLKGIEEYLKRNLGVANG